jgi:hypothetical protein
VNTEEETKATKKPLESETQQSWRQVPQLKRNFTHIIKHPPTGALASQALRRSSTAKIDDRPSPRATLKRSATTANVRDYVQHNVASVF